MLAVLRFSVSTVSKAVLQIERRGEIEPHDKVWHFPQWNYSCATQLMKQVSVPHRPQAFAHIILPLSRILTLGSFTTTWFLDPRCDDTGELLLYLY